MAFIQTHRFARLGYGIAMVSALALGACSYEQGHPGNPFTQSQKLDTAKASLNGNKDFTGELARNYYAVASRRAAASDVTDSDYFAGKSIAASQGQVVAPEQPILPKNYEALPPARAAQEGEMAEHARTWLIPGNASPETADVKVLNDARQSLITALDSGGRERFPSLAARSQALYDCWIERSEHNVGGFSNTQCRTGFVRDYTDLVVLLHPPGQKGVYFGYNSAVLTPEGKALIKQAVDNIRAGTAHLTIVGKADRSGAPAYNTKLSEARAKAVAQAAVAEGLPADRISVSWTGEQQLPVQTKDGVRHDKNRVVEIDTRMPPSQVAELPPAE